MLLKPNIFIVNLSCCGYEAGHHRQYRHLFAEKGIYNKEHDPYML